MNYSMQTCTEEYICVQKEELRIIKDKNNAKTSRFHVKIHSLFLSNIKVFTVLELCRFFIEKYLLFWAKTDINFIYHEIFNQTQFDDVI